MSVKTPASALRRLMDKATVHREVEGDWIIPHTCIPCLARPDTTPKQQVQGDQAAAVGQWKILFEVGTDIRGADRVQVGPHFFEIVDTNAGRTGSVYLTATATSLRET